MFIVNIRFCITVLVAILAASASAREETVLLGVLEDVPGPHAGESSNMKVRTLFSHNTSNWIAYKSDCPNQECLETLTKQYPHEVTWFVTLSGRQTGKIIGRTPHHFSFYSHVGLQNIIDGTVPAVGDPSYEFESFGADKLRRPLVTVSKPHFKDPAMWKRTKITPQISTQALTAFRSKVPQVCKESASGTLVPFRYSRHDLSVRTHRSSYGALIMTIWLQGAYACDGGDGTDLLNAQTFFLSEAGDIRFLGEGLRFVDAGDYDNDGQSELIFSLSRYNRGGYVLFSVAMVELARFEFGYH